MGSTSKALDTIERLLQEGERDRAEIERLKTELKAANERADKAEGRLRRYEGDGMAYAD